jgi:hypothetical protein
MLEAICARFLVSRSGASKCKDAHLVRASSSAGPGRHWCAQRIAALRMGSVSRLWPLRDEQPSSPRPATVKGLRSPRDDLEPGTRGAA